MLILACIMNEDMAAIVVNNLVCLWIYCVLIICLILFGIIKARLAMVEPLHTLNGHCSACLHALRSTEAH